jgi:hypothetical protein
VDISEAEPFHLNARPTPPAEHPAVAGAATWWGWLARLGRAVAWAVVGGLLVGIWQWQAHGQATTATSRSTLSVVVAMSDLGRSPGLPATGPIDGSLDLTVYNRGPLPITLTDRNPDPSPANTAMTVAAPLDLRPHDRTVAAGATAQLSARADLHCPASSRIGLAVQTDDGQVRLATVFQDDQPVYTDSLCPSAAGESVPFELAAAGTATRPLLIATNQSAKPVTIALDSGSPLTAKFFSHFTLDTAPRLPLRLAPYERKVIPLTVTALKCLPGNPPDGSAVAVRTSESAPKPATTPNQPEGALTSQFIFTTAEILDLSVQTAQALTARCAKP